jgi:hypothetical protein
MRLAAHTTIIVGALAAAAIASSVASARFELQPTATTGQTQTTTTAPPVLPNPDQQEDARMIAASHQSASPGTSAGGSLTQQEIARLAQLSRQHPTSVAEAPVLRPTVGPPAVQSASTSQQPEVQRAQTAASHAFAYKPAASGQYSTAALNGSVGSPTNGGPAVVHVTTHENPFDWGDAAIGAAGGLVISLLIVGGAVVVTRRRQHEPSRAKALA